MSQMREIGVFYVARTTVMTRPKAFLVLAGLTLIGVTVIFEYAYEFSRERLALHPLEVPPLLASWIALLHEAHRHLWYEAIFWTLLSIAAGAILIAIGAAAIRYWKRREAVYFWLIWLMITHPAGLPDDWSDS